MDQFQVKWNNHHEFLQCQYFDFLCSNKFTDCILSADGQSIQAHRIILAAASPYFLKLFTFAESLERDPVLILSEMSFSDICSVIEFVYTGNLKISHDQLNHFLAVAGKLQIKGVVGFSIDIKDENEGNFPVIIFGENRVNGVKNVNTEPGGLGSSTIESSSDVSDSPRLIVKQINEIRVLRKCKQSKENIAKSSCKLSCEHCRRKFEKKRTAYNHRRFCLLNPNKRASRCPFCLEVVKPGSMTYHKKTYHAYVPAKRRNTKIAP